MASVSRTTVYRRVGRAVQDDINLILSASSEGVTCSAEAFHYYFVTMPAGSLSPAVSEPAHLSYQQGVPKMCCFPETMPDPVQASVSANDVHANRNVSSVVEGVPCGAKNHTERGIGKNLLWDELSESEKPEVSYYKKRLRQWGLDGSVPHDTLAKLLKILRSHRCFSESVK